MFNSKLPFISNLLSIELNQARLVIYLKNACMVHLFISISRSVSIMPVNMFPWLLKLLISRFFIAYFVKTLWWFWNSAYRSFEGNFILLKKSVKELHVTIFKIDHVNVNGIAAIFKEILWNLLMFYSCLSLLELIIFMPRHYY